MLSGSLVNFIPISLIPATFSFLCLNHSNLEVTLYRYSIFLHLHSILPQGNYNIGNMRGVRWEQWYTFPVALVSGPLYVCMIYIRWA